MTCSNTNRSTIITSTVIGMPCNNGDIAAISISTSSVTNIKTEATTVTNITCTKIDVNRNNINRHEWKKKKEEKERRAKKY